MIRFARHRLDEGGQPIEPTAQWFASADAKIRVAEAEGKAHKVSELYKATDVKVALEKLFYDKCAYCESKITATSDWDVEHFRPKGRVAERKDHPGYYWLAYRWTNLYPSCQHCNQKRKDQARWGDLSVGPAAGKHDQFPLADETTRAMDHHQDIKAEDLLLLDPCHDKPADHLVFNVLGRALSLDDSQRGAASIDIFHLNRRRLRRRRMDTLRRVVDLLRMIRKQKQQGSTAAAADLEQHLHKYHLQDHSEYAGLARCVLEDPMAFGVS